VPSSRRVISFTLHFTMLNGNTSQSSGDVSKLETAQFTYEPCITANIEEDGSSESTPALAAEAVPQRHSAARAKSLLLPLVAVLLCTTLVLIPIGRMRVGPIATSAANEAVQMTAVTDVGTFGNLLSQATAGKPWAEVSVVFDQVTSPNSASTDPNIQALNTYYKSAPPAIHTMIDASIAESKQKGGGAQSGASTTSAGSTVAATTTAR